MAEETVSKEVEMKDVEGGEEKSEKEETSGSQQQKDKNLLIFEGRETELRKKLYSLDSRKPVSRPEILACDSSILGTCWG